MEHGLHFSNCSFSFQDVLRCIGGMKIFLPLLEQISYFEPAKRSRIDSTGQLEVFDLEQSEAKTGAAIERYIMIVQFLCVVLPQLSS